MGRLCLSLAPWQLLVSEATALLESRQLLIMGALNKLARQQALKLQHDWLLVMGQCKLEMTEGEACW